MGEHRYFCVGKSGLSETYKGRKKKKNGREGLKCFITFGWGFFAGFCRTAQSCSSPGPLDCYYLNLLKAEQFRGGICTPCTRFLRVFVNTSLILGNVWLKGYTWLNVSIFQRTHEKKSSVGMEKMTDLIFF